MNTTPLPHARRSERGIALVLTLAILALVVIMLVSFVASMRTESTAAKNYNDLIKARQLAQGAVDQAVAIIRSASDAPTTTRTWVAAPGVIYTVAGGVPVASNLFTDVTVLNAGSYNLNTGGFITGTNNFYNGSSVINAGWQNVTNANGELIGHFAYWVDVEATKVNVNTAGMRTPPNPASATDPFMDQSLPGDVDLRALEGSLYNNSAIATNVMVAHSTPLAQPLFNTADEIGRATGITADDVTQNKFFVTVAGAETNSDAFGRARIDLTAINSTGAQAYSDAANRLNDSAWATVLYPSIITGAATFQSKYGAFGVNQILANIIDYQQPATTKPTHDALDANNIPTSYCGLKKGPMIDDVIVHVATNTTVTAGVSNTVVHTYVDVKFVNGYDQNRGAGYVVKVWPTSITVNFTGGSGSSPTTITPAEVSTNLVNVPAHTFRLLSTLTGGAPPDFPITLPGASNTPPPIVTSATVTLKSVRLLMQDDPDYVEDWMSTADFNANYPAGMAFPGTSVVTNLPNFNASNPSVAANCMPLALSKQDPRVRTFSLSPVTGTSLSTNWCALGPNPPNNVNPAGSDGFTSRIAPEVYSLLADARSIEPTTGNSVTHTYLNDHIAEQPMQSIGELSYIHTGYPWRCVRLRSVIPQTAGSGQNAATAFAEGSLVLPPLGYGDPNSGKTTVEQNAIPDWIMLDIFKVPSQTNAVGRINLNTKFSGAAAGLPSRVPPITALISGTSASNAVPATVTDVISSNIVNRIFVIGSPYANVPAYLTPGEVCEVRDIGYFNDALGAATLYDQFPSKSRRQQLIRRISNLVTTRSNSFTIWCIAQTIKEPNVSGQTIGTFQPGIDQITGEVKVQAIVDRYEDTSTTPATVKFRTRYYRFIND